MTSPSFLMGQTHCKPADERPGPPRSADLGPTGQASVEETGSATFLAARVAQVRSSPRQLGQPWQMLPLEGCWKFITKHIGILGCSWLRFSGIADEALYLNQNTSLLAESHTIHLLPTYTTYLIYNHWYLLKVTVFFRHLAVVFALKASTLQLLN